MELTPAQEQIIADEHRFRVVVCGRKFGKTTLDAEELIGNALSGNDRRVMYLAPTLGDARRLMWDRLRKRLGVAIKKENDTRLELKVRTAKGGVSDIFLGSWELVQNYRGDEFDFILPDECQDYRNFWTGWFEALRPTLTPRQGGAMFTGTPKGFNHLYDLFNLEYTDTDFKSFKFTTYDNPFIPRDEIEKAKQELSEDRFAQEYMADFRKSEGLVYKEFDRARHLYAEPIYDYEDYIAGVDWGFRAPAAVPGIKIKSGHWYVDEEFYKTEVTDSKVAEFVAAKGYNKVYPDPESASGIQELKTRKVNVYEVIKGKDSIVKGINKVRDLFLQNKLHINQKCINLISELESYSHGDNDAELPIDDNNHALDALRYCVLMYSAPKPFIQRPFYDRTIDIWRGR